MQPWLVRSLPMKSRKLLAHDVLDTFGKHAGFVYDVTDTDSWARKGGTYGRAFATFKYRCVRACVRACVCVCVCVPFLSIGPVILLRFGSSVRPSQPRRLYQVETQVIIIRRKILNHDKRPHE